MLSEEYFGQMSETNEKPFGEEADEASPLMGLSEAEVISAAASPSARNMVRGRGRAKVISKPKKDDGGQAARLTLIRQQL